MQKHIDMMEDVLSFENFVLLRKEIISLQTISNVLEITQQQNSIKSSRAHVRSTRTHVHTHTHTHTHTVYFRI